MEEQLQPEITENQLLLLGKAQKLGIQTEVQSLNDAHLTTEQLDLKGTMDEDFAVLVTKVNLRRNEGLEAGRRSPHQSSGGCVSVTDQ